MLIIHYSNYFVSNYALKEEEKDDTIKKRKIEEYSNELVKQMAEKGILEKKQKEADAKFISEKDLENKRLSDKVLF